MEVFIVYHEIVSGDDGRELECVHATLAGARDCVAAFIAKKPRGMYDDSTPWTAIEKDTWESKGLYDQRIMIYPEQVKP